jgi:hypothetical protein
MAIPFLAPFWQLARRVEDIFKDVEQLMVGMKAMREQLSRLDRRVSALETREELLIEKTRTAAATAASGAVTTHLVDMSRRIGALEAGQVAQRRLPDS